MLGLPASAGAPALAETGGLAVAQLLPPCLSLILPVNQSQYFIYIKDWMLVWGLFVFFDFLSVKKSFKYFLLRNIEK